MRKGGLIFLSTLGLMACTGTGLDVGKNGTGGAHGGSGGATTTGGGGQATGGAPTGGSAGGTSAGGAGASSVLGGSGGAGGQATGAGGQAGGAGAVGTGLLVDPSAATFAGTLVEAVSAPQTFTIHNAGSDTAGTTGALAALQGTNAADYLITANGCGATLPAGASCNVAVAFAPKTRSGSRSASLAIGASPGPAASVSLSGTALPSLGLLAGGLGGPGNLDGTGGTASRLSGPIGTASDGAGNLYMLDGGIIRKVALATGIITTIAGAAGSGFADGPGATARFYAATAMTSDGAGNLYVADRNNEVIRKVVMATGAVTTIAGQVNQPGRADGIGSIATFSDPTLIVADGVGNLYVADYYALRKIVLATGAVTTLVDGAGAPIHYGYDYDDYPMAADAAGNLYLADSMDNTILKIVVATGVTTTFAGAAGQAGSADGTGATARFSSPSTLASDGAGNLYVGDNNGLRKIALPTGTVTTLTDGSGGPIFLSYPNSMSSDGGTNLYTCDSGGYAVRRVDLTTGVVTVVAGAPLQAGSADGIGAAARFKSPSGMTVDGAGNLFVADYQNNEIRQIVLATRAVTTLAGTPAGGTADGIGAAAGFFGPMDVLSDGAGNLFVADTYNYTVRKLVLATRTVTTFAGAADQADSVDGTGGAARFGDVFGLVSDGAGNLFVADTNLIRKIVVSTRAVTTIAGMPQQYPLTVADGIGTAARFYGLGGITSDGAGNLYVTDADTVRKIVVATRAVTTLAGNPSESAIVDGTGAAARFRGAGAIAYDGAGSVYVADEQTIRKVDVASATVSTIIGSPDRVGVSLGALPASLNVAYGLLVLPTGELVIADYVENALLIAHL